jgi:hypothetical protein
LKGNPDRSSAANASATAIRPNGAVLAAVLAALAAGYWIWFARETPRRLAVLSLLRDPFSLIAEWFGPAGTPLGILDRLPILALAAFILLAGYGLGRLAIDRLRLADGCSELERAIFGLAAGLSGLSTVVLFVGLAGFLRQGWLLWTIAGGLASYGIWQVLRDLWSRPLGPSASPPRSAIRNPQSAIVWLAAPFAAILLLGACLPPWDFDVREYHLQVPKEWFQQGQITFLPHNVYGNMPLAAEMHALLAMALWPGESGWFYGALAGKVVIAAFAIIAAIAVAAAAHRFAGAAGAIIAALVVISHPWMIHVSVNGLNDGVLACYVLLSLYAMWLARRGQCSFVLPGLYAGAAAATKYPGLAFAVAPVAIWAALPRQRIETLTRPSATLSQGERSFLMPSVRPTVRAVALVLTGVLVGGGAWYAKTSVFAGNPVYPLAYSLFGGTTRTPDNANQWNQAHDVPRDASGWRYSPRKLAASIAKIVGQDDLASPLLLPLLVAAAIAGLAKVGPSRREGPAPVATNEAPVPDGVSYLLLAAAEMLLWILAVWWLVSHRLDRFLLPAWPIAALLAAGAVALEDRWWRLAVKSVVVVGALYCLLAASSQLVGDNRWFVSLEQLRRDGPWPEGTSLRVKPGQQWLIEHARAGESVLLVGDAEPFDLPMPVYYNTCFDDCLLCDWMLEKSAGHRHDELASRKIAWVLVDWPELVRYRSPGNYGFDPRFDSRLVDELVAQGVLGPPQPVAPPAPGQRGVEIYPVRTTSPLPQ